MNNNIEEKAHRKIIDLVSEYQYGERSSRPDRQHELDGQPYAVFWKDINGRMMGCNKRFAKLIDMVEKEIVGRNDYEFSFTQMDIKLARREDTYVIKHNEPLLNMYRVKYKYWNLISKYPVSDSEGRHRCVVGIVKDIREEKLSEHYKLLQHLKELLFTSEILSLGVYVAFIFKLEPELPVIYISNNLERIGLDVNDIYPYQTNFCDFIAPEDREDVYRSLKDNGELMEQFDTTFRLIDNNGETIIVSCTARIVHIKETGEPVVQGFMARRFNADAHEPSHYKGWLTTMHHMDSDGMSEDAFRTMTYILDRASPMIYIVDIDTCDLLYANPKAIERSGNAPEGETLCYKWLYSGRESPCPHCPIGMVTNLDGSPAKPLLMEYFDNITNKWYHSTSYAIKWVDGRTAMFTQKYDVTNAKTTDRKLKQLPYIDTALNLPNRKKLESSLPRAVNECHEGRKVAILTVNLDDFKNINYIYGFDTGNMMLKTIADFMGSFYATNKTVFRTSGDEFMIMLGNSTLEGIEQFVKLLFSRFNMPWLIDGHEIFCTASIGIAIYPDNSKSAEELLRNSVMAIHRAKMKGKRRLEYFDKSEEKQIEENLQLEFKLRKAINNNCHDFAIYYQPIIEAKTDKWIGVEALVRWIDDENIIMPGIFIPMAESLDLISELDNWVLQTAMSQLLNSGLLDDVNFTLSVNMSAVQINDKNLIRYIKGLLDATGYPPKQLIMEVTESTAVSDMQYAVSKLGKIRELGIKVAMDDFGTGFSSLYNMKNMPVDTIKIDRAFINELSDDEFNQAFIKTISMLAHSMGVSVCAEGVEDHVQKRILTEKDSDFLQGYLFGRPMPLDDLMNIGGGYQAS